MVLCRGFLVVLGVAATTGAALETVGKAALALAFATGILNFGGDTTGLAVFFPELCCFFVTESFAFTAFSFHSYTMKVVDVIFAYSHGCVCIL